MYNNSLRHRTNPNHANHLFSFTSKHPKSKLSLKASENLQRELDAHHTRKASILYRHNLLEHQNKINYTNELNRIRGELSRNDNRLPQGTREHLKERIEALEKLGGKLQIEKSC